MYAACNSVSLIYYQPRFQTFFALQWIVRRNGTPDIYVIYKRTNFRMNWIHRPSFSYAQQIMAHKTPWRGFKTMITLKERAIELRECTFWPLASLAMSEFCERDASSFTCQPDLRVSNVSIFMPRKWQWEVPRMSPVHQLPTSIVRRVGCPLKLLSANDYPRAQLFLDESGYIDEKWEGNKKLV